MIKCYQKCSTKAEADEFINDPDQYRAKQKKKKEEEAETKEKKVVNEKIEKMRPKDKYKKTLLKKRSFYEDKYESSYDLCRIPCKNERGDKIIYKAESIKAFTEEEIRNRLFLPLDHLPSASLEADETVRKASSILRAKTKLTEGKDYVTTRIDFKRPSGNNTSKKKLKSRKDVWKTQEKILRRMRYAYVQMYNASIACIKNHREDFLKSGKNDDDDENDGDDEIDDDDENEKDEKDDKKNQVYKGLSLKILSERVIGTAESTNMIGYRNTEQNLEHGKCKFCGDGIFKRSDNRGSKSLQSIYVNHLRNKCLTLNDIENKAGHVAKNSPKRNLDERVLELINKGEGEYKIEASNDNIQEQIDPTTGMINTAVFALPHVKNVPTLEKARMVCKEWYDVPAQIRQKAVTEAYLAQMTNVRKLKENKQHRWKLHYKRKHAKGQCAFTIDHGTLFDFYRIGKTSFGIKWNKFFKDKMRIYILVKLPRASKI